ncbi:class I SAM-dependent methyltransferase [Poseidonocella sp. HB161398]|uniref:class I SAM-dependent methyltransferase n=1 Tax=Poseidonocella sp. HB161398 TaxID=2320855 RepID=UPI0011080E6A|nr:class I SAM-dependent methyltransferase [Poseidonocella sp. HB161398]
MTDTDTAVTPETPSFAFDPGDPWTRTFQKGLERAGLDGKRVYEVGIGTGINAAFLLRMCRAADVSGSDLDPRLAALAERNVRNLAPEEAHRFHPVHGAVSLIDTDEARARIARSDAVIACIPQVGDPGDARVAAFRDAHEVELGDSAQDRSDDHIAHYYPWNLFDQYPYNAIGLGLNEALLRRVREAAPTAQLIMNFGARIPVSLLEAMFEANGYRPEVLHSQMVRQDGGTDISFFVTLERAMKGTGFEAALVCEFFADPQGRMPLSACEAQALQEDSPGTPLFHRVCVIRGTPA